MENKTYGLVISSYKYGHLASHCIESVLCQTKKFDKIWFVDDGVGDCYFLEKLYPTILFVFRKENYGVVKNFQDMLQKVDTDFVMFLGADNWLRADTLEHLTYMKPHTDIVTFDIIVTGTLRHEIITTYPNEIIKTMGDFYWSRKFKHHGSMLYKTKLALESGGYANNFTSIRTDEDLNLWEKMIKRGATLSHVEEGLLYYRRHQENFYKY